MTFEEWWCDESRSDEDNRHIGYEYAKEAWDYQQNRIDELEHKLALREAFIAGIQFGKALESE